MKERPRICIKCAGGVSKAMARRAAFQREVIAVRTEDGHRVYVLACGHEQAVYTMTFA